MHGIFLQHCSVINCSSTRVETSLHRSRRTVHGRRTSARGITRQGKVRRSRICSASAGTTADFAKQFEELSNACEYLKSMPPSEVRSEYRAWLTFVAAGGAFAESRLILLICVSSTTAIKLSLCTGDAEIRGVSGRPGGLGSTEEVWSGLQVGQDCRRWPHPP